MRALLIYILYLCLTACGIKGPLYIPEKQYPQDGTATSQTSSSDSSNSIKKK